MLIFLCILQLAVAILLARLLWWAKTQYKISINFYNLPIILIFTIGILSMIYLSLHHFVFYIVTGLFLGTMMFGISSTEVENLENVSFSRKMIISLLSTFFWPQMATFMFFFYAHMEFFMDDEK